MFQTLNLQKMSNSFFHFKQFSVHHDKCGMKVGTDGVLLGAWPSLAHNDQNTNVLDIGTGTGLVALMLAQRFENVHIDAVEIDEDAFAQAIDNFSLSPWTDRLNAIHSDFNDYSKNCDKKYELIVSNPPYFEDSLKASAKNRSQARHTDTLSFAQLLSGAKSCLATNGCFYVILPSDKYETIAQLASENDMYISSVLWIKGNEQQPIKRSIIELKHSKGNPPSTQQKTLVIEKERHQYTDDYITITKDFYLKM